MGGLHCVDEPLHVVCESRLAAQQLVKKSRNISLLFGDSVAVSAFLDHPGRTVFVSNKSPLKTIAAGFG